MAMQEKIKEYGQNLFLEAQATNRSSNKEKAALQDMARLTRDGFVKLMIEYNLDSLVTPFLGPCGVSVNFVLAIGGFLGISARLFQRFRPKKPVLKKARVQSPFSSA